MRHYTVNVKGNSLNLYPVSDTQLGAGGFEKAGFKEWVKEIKADPLAHIIGVGDYIDGVSPSNRRLLLAAFTRGELYDTARDMLDDAARAYMEQFINLIRGTEGKWDVILSGHHLWEYDVRDGEATNTDMYLAAHVGAPYSPDGTVVVSYVFPKGTLTVWAAHGEGGTATYSGPLNQLEKMMRGFNADVYIVAHHHKLVAARAVKLEKDDSAPTRLRATDGLLVGAGSWLRGYMPDETSYAEAGLMAPLATGSPIIRVTQRKDGSFKVRCEI